MPPTRLRRFVVLGVALVAAACSRGSNEATRTPRPPTPTPTPSTQVVVVPSVGEPEASFALEARGFVPGERLWFEIVRPDGSTFRGTDHTVSAAGAVNTVYKPSTAGSYTVHAVTERGARAQTQFRVETGGSPGPSPTGSPEPRT